MIISTSTYTQRHLTRQFFPSISKSLSHRLQLTIIYHATPPLYQPHSNECVTILQDTILKDIRQLSHVQNIWNSNNDILTIGFIAYIKI